MIGWYVWGYASMGRLTIVPSDKLRVVTVHKLQAASCQRRYFWQYIMNLEPRGLRLPLWFGSMIHAGLDVWLRGGTAKGTALAMKAKDKELLADTPSISPDLQTELHIWRSIAPAMIEGFREVTGDKMRLTSCEEKFAVPLLGNVTFCGTLDGRGTHDGKSTLFEFKTAGQISKDTFSTMAFNKQVYGYLSSIPAVDLPEQFAYCVLRKPSKWLKRGQSVEAFIEELKADFIARPDFYFAIWEQPVGKNAIEDVAADIRSAATDLAMKYKSLGIGYSQCEKLYDPHSWPRDDRQCHDYGNCPYLELCKDARHWKARAGAFYRQREIRYELEREELQDE
jgi:hypothetical protein